MKQNQQNKQNTFIVILCLLFSIISGIITNDLLIGGTILATGLLCAYFASIGKRINYLLGLINYLLMGYVSLKNNLYGICIFYIFIFSPLQLKGFITWKNYLNEEKNIIIRNFTIKNSIIITSSCILGSLVLGYLLSLIPNQQLALMDATSNCINLCGTILMILRFKEAWWLWLVNNMIDLIIWTIVVINKGDGAVMALLAAIGFLLINIYGIIKWNIKEKIK